MNRESHIETSLEALLNGDQDADLDGLAMAAKADPKLAEKVRAELEFSEMIRQVFHNDIESTSEDLHWQVSHNEQTESELFDLACDGRHSRFDLNRVARYLGENADRIPDFRLRLIEDEWLRQAVSKSKSEESFVEALETRMWAESKVDHFVEDFSARLEEEFSDHKPDILDFPGVWSKAAMELVAVAAAVALTAFLAVVFISGSGDEAGGAVVAEASKVTSDVIWSGDSPVTDGTSFRSGTYQLESGLVSLRFANGNEMTVQGPALFDLESDSSAFVHSGLAVARSEANDLGFTLKSKGLSISQPAKMIGIDARSDHSTEALVFEGDAGVCLDDGGKCREIYQYEAVKTDKDSGRLVDVPYNPRAFEKAWALVAGVENNLGDVKFEMPGTEIHPSKGSSGHVQVYVEKEAFEPEKGIEVDQLATGIFADATVNSGQSLQANGKLTSYLLQLWPEGQSSQDNGEEVEASLTFDQPVVGLIFSSERLASSDAEVGTSISHIGVEEISGRGLDSGNDWILLSEDRRTVNLRLKGGKAQLDQVRVLVASK